MPIKFHSILLLILILILLAGCGGPAIPAVTDPQIARHPVSVQTSLHPGPITTLPVVDPNSMNPFQIDFRWADLTRLDLSNSLDLLSMAEFDSKTQWPRARMLPKGFSLKKVMDLAKDPGLGIRKLHDRGINGKGIKIAILDNTLLTDHVEYKDRLKLYEETEDLVDGWVMTSLHGAAVASIAVGQTVGVAPGAELYFIAEGGCYNTTRSCLKNG